MPRPALFAGLSCLEFEKALRHPDKNNKRIDKHTTLAILNRSPVSKDGMYNFVNLSGPSPGPSLKRVSYRI